MSEHDDALAALRAQFDQFAEASKELARTVTVYYEALTDEGMDASSALLLAAGFQATILTNAGNAG